MYLNSVLDALAKKRKTFTAEDLYKLNEAIFNLPEVEVINQKTTARLFAALETINRAYADGHSQRADPNFFYDYVALLATMQNQHFFDGKQNKSILSWLYEALGHEVGPPPGPAKGKGKEQPSAAALKRVAALEAENDALKKELEKLRTLSEAVAVLKAFKPVTAPEGAPKKSKTKNKSKRKGKSGSEVSQGEAVEGEASEKPEEKKED